MALAYKTRKRLALLTLLVGLCLLYTSDAADE